jgi:hypothetical protein
MDNYDDFLQARAEAEERYINDAMKLIQWGDILAALDAGNSAQMADNMEIMLRGYYQKRFRADCLNYEQYRARKAGRYDAE